MVGNITVVGRGRTIRGRIDPFSKYFSYLKPESSPEHKIFLNKNQSHQNFRSLIIKKFLLCRKFANRHQAVCEYSIFKYCSLNYLIFDLNDRNTKWLFSFQSLLNGFHQLHGTKCHHVHHCSLDRNATKFYIMYLLNKKIR